MILCGPYVYISFTSITSYISEAQKSNMYVKASEGICNV